VGRDGGSGGNRWQGYSHQELYDMLHSGPGAAASGGVADQWSELAGALTDIQQELNAGVRDSGATWTGSAGDAARGALGPLGEWAQQASTAADVMRISTELQGDLLSKARAAMPAPIPVPQQPGQIGQLLAAQIDYEVTEMASQGAEQAAHQVMAQYEAATDDNTSTLGDFGEPPTLVVDTTPVTGLVVRSPVNSSEAPGSASRPTTSTVPAPSESEETPSSRQRIPSARPADETPVVEGADEAAPTAEAAPGTGLAAGATAPPRTTTTPTTPGATGSTAPSATGSAAPGATDSTAPSSATPATPAAPPAAGMRPDVRPSGPGTTTSSFDPSTVDSDSPAAPAIPASRDRDSSRFAGGAMVPAARRADDDDEDDVHVSTYLIEADDIYGDPRTYTPPVIGESPRHR
jgi:hypothetical protein